MNNPMKLTKEQAEKIAKESLILIKGATYTTDGNGIIANYVNGFMKAASIANPEIERLKARVKELELELEQKRNALVTALMKITENI